VVCFYGAEGGGEEGGGVLVSSQPGEPEDEDGRETRGQVNKVGIVDKSGGGETGWLTCHQQERGFKRKNNKVGKEGEDVEGAK